MARSELVQVTQIGVIGAGTRKALVIPGGGPTVITLTQRMFERSGDVPDHFALQVTARDGADALRWPLPSGTWPGSRRRPPLSRQCRAGLLRPWLLAKTHYASLPSARYPEGMRAGCLLLLTPR